MPDYFLSLASSLSERGLSRKVKLALNFVFVASITHFLFVTFYFDYVLLAPTDLDSNFRFFVEGHFIVPLCLFVFVWKITDWLCVPIFKLPNMLIARRARRAVKNFSMKKFTLFDDADPNMKAAVDKFVEMPTDRGASHLFELFREVIKPEDYAKIQRSLQIGQRRLDDEAVLVVRTLVAVTFYFVHLEYFGWIVFAAVWMTCLLWLMLLAFAFQFLEFTPVLLSLIDNWGTSQQPSDVQHADV